MLYSVVKKVGSDIVIFTRRKLFQTNKYSQFSLVISALKDNEIHFQVKENDIQARYGLFGIDKQLLHMYLGKQILSIPYMSEKKITIPHHTCFIHC